MVAKTLAMSLSGLQGTLVEVETELTQGLPAFTIVGLPDSSTLQAKERVRGACANCGYSINDRKITVNLIPAWLPKGGSNFDLAIAMGVLACRKVVNPHILQRVLFIGELTLDAQIRAVPGVLPSVRAAVEQGITKIVVPAQNAAEAKLVRGAEIRAFSHLHEVIKFFGGKAAQSAENIEYPKMFNLGEAGSESNEKVAKHSEAKDLEQLDFSQVQGQKIAVRAAEIVAAGGHHLLMIGAPGSGKTMIASRIPTILPPLDDATALTLSAINSIAGKFDAKAGLNRTAPFVAPHHSASPAAIIGGGTAIAAPGAISKAHGGVLFLDEAAEFSSRVLESLREPLEKGEIELHRAKGATVYPARFQLVLAANPCPCGNAIGKAKSCSCSSIEKRRYKNRLSGPILDRIDVRIQVTAAKLSGAGAGRAESSQRILERVMAAKMRQLHRFKGAPFTSNATVSTAFLDAKMPLPDLEEALILRAVEKQQLTMRGRDRVRKIAWTLADLAQKAKPGADEVAEALALRGESLL